MITTKEYNNMIVERLNKRLEKYNVMIYLEYQKNNGGWWICYTKNNQDVTASLVVTPLRVNYSLSDIECLLDAIEK